MKASLWLKALTTLLLACLDQGQAQNKGIKFILVTESAQPELNSKFSNGLKAVQDQNPDFRFEIASINFTRKYADDAYAEFCSLLQSQAFAAVIDLTWGGWIKGRKKGAELSLPYVRVEAANHPFVQAVDNYLHHIQSTDAALLFPHKIGLDQSLYYIIGKFS